MAAIKSATLTLRIEPGLKEALSVAAQGAHRSVSNMVELLIRDYCTHNGVYIPLSGAKTSARRSKKEARR